ncbi:MAG: NADH-quinone oxidoreductase subunit NuoB [Bacillota bacterium]
MLRLFKKSMQTGRVTTGYPFTPDPAPPGFRGRPELAEAKCTRCGICVRHCPTGALSMEKAGTGTPRLKVEKCIFCGLCEEKCLPGAMTLSGRYELAAVALRDKVRRIFGRSAHIRHLDAGSCNGCDWEMVALTGPVYDIQRLGFDFVASPRHADILMVTGPVTRNLEIAALKTFAATPDPKLVVAVGTCACSGGICATSYAHHSGVNNVLPVDVYIPGCPPRPQALIHGLMLAVEKSAMEKLP